MEGERGRCGSAWWSRGAAWQVTVQGIARGTNQGADKQMAMQGAAGWSEWCMSSQRLQRGQTMPPRNRSVVNGCHHATVHAGAAAKDGSSAHAALRQAHRASRQLPGYNAPPAAAKHACPVPAVQPPLRRCQLVHPSEHRRTQHNSKKEEKRGAWPPVPTLTGTALLLRPPPAPTGPQSWPRQRSRKCQRRGSCTRPAC